MQSHVEHYGAAHRARVNQILHFVGIPVLLISSLGLLSKASLPLDWTVPALRPNAAWVVLLGAGGWYLWQDWKVGALLTAAFAGCYVLGSGLTAGLLTALFGAGVAAHAVGHYAFEGKAPAVFSSPVALLEAPAWLLSTWAGTGEERRSG